jgi:hypothetical protein
MSNADDDSYNEQSDDESVSIVCFSFFKNRVFTVLVLRLMKNLFTLPRGEFVKVMLITMRKPLS